MSLSSSLNAGVAGLNVNSSKLSTISDNIANSQTAGYKRVDTQFSTLVVSGGGGNYTAGGVQSATLREVDSGGGIITSSNATDIAIAGRGFIPVTPNAAIDNLDGDLPVQYLPTGSFRLDADGVLRTASGLTLLGWPANRDGTIPAFTRDSTAGLEPVQINSGALTNSPTTEIELGVNLPAAQTREGSDGTPLPLSIEYFDNVGASQSLDLTFTPTVPATGSSNTWTLSISDSLTDAASNPVASFTVTFDETAALGGSILNVTSPVGGAYDADTGAFSMNTAAGPLDILIGAPGTSEGLTQLSAEFAPTGVQKNGTPVGSLTSIDIDENGFVKGVFANGGVRTLYQIPIADFPNINGLTAVNSQAYTASSTSGSLFLWDAGDGPTGTVVNFALEQSTADVAVELTSLITTQRAYSSNATVIRTVDEMLQETTNIKR
ncbi:MAG: flagellar hook-basal body complex protein [Pseudomonadota bacterium]